MVLAPSSPVAVPAVQLTPLLLLLQLQQLCVASFAAALAAAAAVLRPLLLLAVLLQLPVRLLLQCLLRRLNVSKVWVVAGHLCGPRQGCTAMWLLAAAPLEQASTLDACTAAHTRQHLVSSYSIFCSSFAVLTVL
jgi:hypothetical protein